VFNAGGGSASNASPSQVTVGVTNGADRMLSCSTHQQKRAGKPIVVCLKFSKIDHGFG